MTLLDRDGFRDAVFQRDGHACVKCSAPADAAHHIIERRLFPDGGYDVDNGASLCEACHWLAEQTVLSPDELRRLAGIRQVVLPPGFDPDRRYDKWGNPYLPDGRRARGPLFDEEGTQRALRAGGQLGEFAWEVPPEGP